MRRLLTIGLDNEPQWVRLYLQQIDETWAAMILADGEQPPEPGQLKGLAFFGGTSKEAEREALAYLGYSEPAN